MLQQKGDEEVLKDTLIRDLTATFRRGHDEDRLLHFEEAVMPMFQALPKKFERKPRAGNSTSCFAPIVLAPPRLVHRRSSPRRGRKRCRNSTQHLHNMDAFVSHGCH